MINWTRPREMILTSFTKVDPKGNLSCLSIISSLHGAIFFTSRKGKAKFARKVAIWFSSFYEEKLKFFFSHSQSIKSLHGMYSALKCAEIMSISCTTKCLASQIHLYECDVSIFPCSLCLQKSLADKVLSCFSMNETGGFVCMQTVAWIP